MSFKLLSIYTRKHLTSMDHLCQTLCNFVTCLIVKKISFVLFLVQYLIDCTATSFLCELTSFLLFPYACNMHVRITSSAIKILSSLIEVLIRDCEQ